MGVGCVVVFVNGDACNNCMAPCLCRSLELALILGSTVPRALNGRPAAISAHAIAWANYREL